jgi:hypothetical protein
MQGLLLVRYLREPRKFPATTKIAEMDTRQYRRLQEDAAQYRTLQDNTIRQAHEPCLKTN